MKFKDVPQTLIDAINAMKTELPGISIGYIGNIGVDRCGPFDDTNSYVFLPHPGRIGTHLDQVNIDERHVADVELLKKRVRELYGRFYRGMYTRDAKMEIVDWDDERVLCADQARCFYHLYGSAGEIEMKAMLEIMVKRYEASLR